MIPIVTVLLASGEEVPVQPPLVRALRNVQTLYPDFVEAWRATQSLREAFPDAEQARIVWELVRFRREVQASHYESALEFECPIVVRADGRAVTEYGGKELSFVQDRGWIIAQADDRAYDWLPDAVARILELASAE